jgi:hypothetical protein
MTKGSAVEKLLLIFIVAFGLILFISLYILFTKEINVTCKRTQMDELDKIWKELDKFESMKGTIQPASYNTIQNFEVKKDCVSKIEYKEETVSGSVKTYLVITWNDKIVQKMPTKAEWKTEGSNGLVNLELEGGVWDMEVSLGKVIAKRVK